MGETGNKQGTALFPQVINVSLTAVWRTDEGGSQGGRWETGRPWRFFCCLRAVSGSGGVVAVEGEKRLDSECIWKL